MDKLKFAYDNKVVVILLFFSLLYLGKVTYFPNEVELVKRKLARISAIGSYQATPNTEGVSHRLSSFRELVSSQLIVDLSDYTENEDSKNYNLEEVAALAPLYFSSLINVRVLFRDIIKLEEQKFQLTTIVRGRTIKGGVDNAYNIIVTFNRKWIITKVQVLAPPRQAKSAPATE